MFYSYIQLDIKFSISILEEKSQEQKKIKNMDNEDAFEKVNF